MSISIICTYFFAVTILCTHFQSGLDTVTVCLIAVVDVIWHVCQMYGSEQQAANTARHSECALIRRFSLQVLKLQC